MSAIRTAPLTTVPAANHAQTRKTSHHPVQCCKCDKYYMEAAVVTGPLKCDFQGEFGIQNQHYKERWLYCDHCNHLQVIFQISDANGQLFNVPYVGPGYLKDPRKIAAFLKAHPEAAGVEQA